MSIRALGTQSGRSSGQMSRLSIHPSPSMHMPRRHISDRMSCECSLSAEKVERHVIQRQLQGLRMEMIQCRLARRFEKWDSYGVDKIIEKVSCKALESLQQTVPLILEADPKKVKAISKNTPINEYHLSIFTDKSELVTLGGEGGYHVGRRDYWDSLFKQLKDQKHLQTHLISIGGGIGYDLSAMAKIFRLEGFKIDKAVVVDPHLIASLLSEELDVDYYVMIGEEFMDNHFVRREDHLYVFHLGTTLNVVTPEIGTKILEKLQQKMSSMDILSLLLVDQKQITGGKFTEKDVRSTLHGLTKVIDRRNQKHYKTVIGDEGNFLHFMEKLNFKGELISIKREPVLFIAYKAIKN